MREIKYRVYDEKGRKMLSFDVLQRFALLGLIFTEENQYKAMQYTGLKDKNGIEIYEGDLVQVEGLFPNDPFKVWFRSGLFHIGNWNTQGFMNAFDFYEVVGNIYENQELLEKE